MFRCSRKFSVGKTQNVVFHLPSNRFSQKIVVNGKQLPLPRWQGFLVLLPTVKLLFCIQGAKEEQTKIDAALSNAKSEAPWSTPVGRGCCGGGGGVWKIAYTNQSHKIVRKVVLTLGVMDGKWMLNGETVRNAWHLYSNSWWGVMR